jgi:hypothetical protein
LPDGRRENEAVAFTRLWAFDSSSVPPSHVLNRSTRYWLSTCQFFAVTLSVVPMIDYFTVP